MTTVAEAGASVAIRAFEEAEAEVRRVAELVKQTFAEYDRAVEQMREHGITIEMEMPLPLGGAYQAYRARVDLHEGGS